MSHFRRFALAVLLMLASTVFVFADAAGPWFLEVGIPTLICLVIVVLVIIAALILLARLIKRKRRGGGDGEDTTGGAK